MNEFLKLKYCVIDVDGTLTDSGIYYDERGNELKKFSTRDAAGIIAAHYMGIKILVVTGRECEATYKRMKELKIDFVFQKVKNKKEFIYNFMKEHHISREQMAYLGDDLNDYPAMALAGFVACPADSCEEVKEVADYISTVVGGGGVVQDVFRHVLSKVGKWETFIENIVEAGY